MAKRTPYQDRIIKNYYKNFDLIQVQRLGEVVTDLYLAEGQKRTRLWKRVEETLVKLEIPEKRIRQIIDSNNPALVADILKEMLDKGSK